MISAEQGSQTTKVYADDWAREARELARKTEEVAAALPPDGSHLALQAIRFDESQKKRGLKVIFTAGTVSAVESKSVAEGALLVPQRTLMILDELGISYILVHT